MEIKVQCFNQHKRLCNLFSQNFLHKTQLCHSGVWDYTVDLNWTILCSSSKSLGLKGQGKRYTSTRIWFLWCHFSQNSIKSEISGNGEKGLPAEGPWSRWWWGHLIPWRSKMKTQNWIPLYRSLVHVVAPIASRGDVLVTFAMRAETSSLCVISSPASNCATTAFSTSLVMDGSTRSS